MNTELKAKKHGLFNMKVDMTSGPLYKNYVIYTIPYIIALLIQNTYNAADMIILGRFASETAVAAVGATSSITSVVVNFFIGFAIGYNIVIVRLFGEKDKEELKRANSTAFIVSLSVGVALMILGLIFAEPLLLLVKCPASILSDSALYARIYFLSLPGLMFFNHFSSLIKATGDSVTSVYYLIVSAVSNIVLNLFFVVVLKMPVLGVAIATTTSIYVTAILCFIKVLHLDEFSRLELSGMRFSGEIFKKIFKYGIPSSVAVVAQNLVGLLSSSAKNSFGEQVVAAISAKDSATMLFMGITYCFGSALTSFMGQNMGAGNRDRVLKIRRFAYFLTSAIAFVITVVLFVFRRGLLTLYLPDSPEAIGIGVRAMEYQLLTALLYGVNWTASSSLMAMGKSTVNMIITLLGSVVFVAIWYLFIFPQNPTIDMMLTVIPLTALINLTFVVVEFAFFKKYKSGAEYRL